MKKKKIKLKVVSPEQQKLEKEVDLLLQQEQIFAKVNSEPKYQDLSFEKLIPSIENFLGERMKCYALIGFAYDGKPVNIMRTNQYIDTYALDKLLAQAASERIQLSNIIIANNVKDYLRGEIEEDE